MSNNEKKSYPDITLILKAVGAVWAMGLVTYIIAQEKEPPLILWGFAAALLLGTEAWTFLKIMLGGRLVINDNPKDTKKNDTP